MASEPQTAESKHTDFTLDFYNRMDRDFDKHAVRSAHSDAAHMCDAIARDLEAEHTVRGRVTNQGRALVAAAKRAGDAIWAMREKVS